METRQTEAKSEGYSLQEESFRVFAEQRYLREHTQLQEVFAQYGREYQYILFDEPDDGEEKKRDVSSPQVFFSYAWPILDRFPHEWWHQLFLVGLRRDLRDLFRIEAYVDVIDSIDNPVRYMIENFSQEFFESQDEARHRSSLNAQGSSKLICMMGSQSFVEKCMNEEFIGSMVRDEKTYIQDYISTYTRSRAPLAQIPVMAFSLGHYRRSILPNFQGHINAYEAHKHSYGQYIQAILYKLFLCMPHTEEQKSRCEDLLLRMRNDPRLEELHKRTDDSIKEYYLDEHLLENVEQLRNDYNLPHWPDGELERVVGIWRDSISEERAQSSVVCQRSLFSNAFLDLIDASAMIDEDFLAIGDTLKARYLEESTIALFEDERPIPLEKLFVNLVIVQENEQRKKDLSMKEVGREDFQVLTQHYDDIHTPKEEIDVKNIFKGSNNLSEQKTPRKIELLGRAGIGKTTFLLYLLRQWALGEPWLEGYQAMFYFPLKKVVHKYDKGGAYSMAEVLRKEFFLGVPDFTLEKANAYWRYILNNSSHYLFVFDGYDEVASDEHPVVEMLFREAPSFIVTSRPEARIWKAGLVRKVDLVLENIGFLEENIKTYVTQFFDFYEENFEGGEEKSEALSADHPLLEWLASHNAVKMMCRIPINLELICQLWSGDSPLFQRSSVSVGDLYETIFNKLIKRYLSKLQKFEKSIKNMRPVQWLNCSETRKVTLFLKHVAFEGVKQNRLIIDYAMVDEVLIAHQELCEDPDILLHLARSGLLKSIDSEATLSNQSFYFMHYSFQEYLAGCYIADTLESQETQNFISQYKYSSAYQSVMVYAAASMKNDINKLDSFYDILLSPPRDLWGGSEFELLSHCGEAAGWPEGWKGARPLLEVAGQRFETVLLEEHHDDNRLYYRDKTVVFSDLPQMHLRMIDSQGHRGMFEILVASCSTKEINIDHNIWSYVPFIQSVLDSVTVEQMLEWINSMLESEGQPRFGGEIFYFLCDLSMSEAQINSAMDNIESMLERRGIEKFDEVEAFLDSIGEQFTAQQASRAFAWFERRLANQKWLVRSIPCFITFMDLTDEQLDRLISLVYLRKCFSATLFDRLRLSDSQSKILLKWVDMVVSDQRNLVVFSRNDSDNEWSFLRALPLQKISIDRIWPYIVRLLREDKFMFKSCFASDILSGFELTAAQIDQLLDFINVPYYDFGRELPKRFSNQVIVILKGLKNCALSEEQICRVLELMKALPYNEERLLGYESVEMVRLLFSVLKKHVLSVEQVDDLLCFIKSLPSRRVGCGSILRGYFWELIEFLKGLQFTSAQVANILNWLNEAQAFDFVKWLVGRREVNWMSIIILGFSLTRKEVSEVEHLVGLQSLGQAFLSEDFSYFKKLFGEEIICYFLEFSLEFLDMELMFKAVSYVTYGYSRGEIACKNRLINLALDDEKKSEIVDAIIIGLQTAWSSCANGVIFCFKVLSFKAMHVDKILGWIEGVFQNKIKIASGREKNKHEIDLETSTKILCKLNLTQEQLDRVLDWDFFVLGDREALRRMVFKYVKRLSLDSNQVEKILPWLEVQVTQHGGCGEELFDLCAWVFISKKWLLNPSQVQRMLGCFELRIGEMVRCEEYWRSIDSLLSDDVLSEEQKLSIARKCYELILDFNNFRVVCKGLVVFLLKYDPIDVFPANYINAFFYGLQDADLLGVWREGGIFHFEYKFYRDCWENSPAQVLVAYPDAFENALLAWREQKGVPVLEYRREQELSGDSRTCWNFFSDAFERGSQRECGETKEEELGESPSKKLANG